MKLLAACTTVATIDDARRLAEAAVARSLAACVHLERIDSVYRWQGVVHSEAEVRLVFKTTEAAYPALERLLRSSHPYELPAIYAVPVEHADPAYAAWVAGAVAATPADADER